MDNQYINDSEFKELAQGVSLNSYGFVYPSFIFNAGTLIEPVLNSIGGPAGVMDFKDYDFMLAVTNDGVGTKNKIADKLEAWLDLEEKIFEGNIIQERENFDKFGIDLVAMNANDLLCVGAIPLALCLDVSFGKNEINRRRAENFLKGLNDGLSQAGMWLVGGETAVLKDMASEDSINISGAGIGIIKPKTRLMLGDKIQDGDIIIGLESFGLHSNGYTKVREIINKFFINDLLKLRLSNGELLINELLCPTKIYVKKISEIFKRKIDVHYISHITGGGWKKIMRAGKHFNGPEFSYVIESLPSLPPIFKFLQKEGSVSDEEAYQTWNMGIGMVIIAPEKSFNEIKTICESLLVCSHHYHCDCLPEIIKTCYLGKVEKGPNQVIIKPKNIILR